MKTLNRAAHVIKTIGTVLILLSLVFALYALINTGSSWNALNTGMNRYGLKTGIVDRAAFDNRFFDALSVSSSNSAESEEERMGAAEIYFARYFRQIDAVVDSSNAKLVSDTVEWLENADTAEIGERLEALESQTENRELREIFEYIDKLAAAPKGKGGKLGGLKAASQEPVLREFYEGFMAEHGEDEISWYEFMLTVKTMIEKDGSVKDVKTWLGSGFDEDDFRIELEEIRVRESSEAAESFAAVLANEFRKKDAGEQTDFDEILTSIAAYLDENYPDLKPQNGTDTVTALAAVIPELLSDEGFDGSYGAVAEKVNTAGEADGILNADTWKKEYLRQVLSEADNRQSISAVGIFWMVTAQWLRMLGIGILLIIVSVLLKRLVSYVLLKRRKDVHVDEDTDVLLRVDHLKQYFRSGGAVTKAVDDVSFYIKKGEVFGLVGESGCGKTSTGRTIINLYDPTEGDVYFGGLRISSSQNGLPVLKAQLRQEYDEKIEKARKNGKADEVSALKKELKQKLRKAEDNALESYVEKSKCVEFYRQKRLKELKEAYDADMKTLTGPEAEERTRRYETERKVAAKDNVLTRMQMIFQDPIASINPRMTVREIIAEGLIIRGVKDKEYIDRKVYEVLELVGLVREHADRYPHEFSGGQRQRIGIARAIIMEPDLIIADEPISALDVSIQAQVINLLNDLRESMGLTIMFIAHNLSVVKYFSDRIGVMYYGKLVELADSDELFRHPIHPYTHSLLSAIPLPDPHSEKNRRRITYNPLVAHDYSVDKPTMREILPGHFVYCNDAEEKAYKRDLNV